MDAERIVYITGARLPTEKAHGLQIAKMCEAFARRGVRVALLHPRRFQWDRALRGESVFRYYAVDPIFEVEQLPNIDPTRIDHLVPAPVSRAIFFAHSVLWGCFAACEERRRGQLAGEAIHFTRDIPTAYWLTRFGLPTVYEGHTLPRRGRRALLRRVARQPALRLTVAVTSFLMQEFLDMGFPAERTVTLPNGVDLRRFEGVPEREACRRMLGLPLDRPIIGCFGRFHTQGEEKGLPELVRATARFAATSGARPLLLCVGGPMSAEAHYREIARRAGAPTGMLRCVDHVPHRDAPLWLRAFDIAAAPFPDSSHYARYMSPLKLPEYMASGTAILATDLPACREALGGGEAAWLAAPGSVEALAEGMAALLGNDALRRRLAGNALRAVRGRSWEHRAQAIRDRLRTGDKHG
ncbi:MAG: glycosyltransferase family 4 protein [Syntrophobacteraceae bacterium]